MRSVNAWSQCCLNSMQVHGFSYSKNWDARVAAGETLGLLADAFPHHTPPDLEAAAASAGPSSSTGNGAGAASTAVPLQSTSALAGFVLQQVLAKGKPLLSSGGQVGAPWLQQSIIHAAASN